MSRPPCPPLTPDARTESVRQTIHHFLHTNRLHRAAIEVALADLGIHHSQHRMLLHIHRAGGALTQKELARELDISAAAVTATLKKLESAGYIHRSEKAGDSRCKQIAITPSGVDVLERSYDLFTAVDLSMFGDFSREELAAFSSMLLRMQAALAAGGGAV